MAIGVNGMLDILDISDENYRDVSETGSSGGVGRGGTYSAGPFRASVRRHFRNVNTQGKGKGKGKVHPRTGHEGPEGE